MAEYVDVEEGQLDSKNGTVVFYDLKRRSHVDVPIASVQKTRMTKHT